MDTVRTGARQGEQKQSEQGMTGTGSSIRHPLCIPAVWRGRSATVRRVDGVGLSAYKETAKVETLPERL